MDAAERSSSGSVDREQQRQRAVGKAPKQGAAATAWCSSSSSGVDREQQQQRGAAAAGKAPKQENKVRALWRRERRRRRRVAGKKRSPDAPSRAGKEDVGSLRARQ